MGRRFGAMLGAGVVALGVVGSGISFAETSADGEASPAPPAESVQALSETTCGDGNACFWSGSTYTGIKVSKDNINPGFHPIGQSSKSFKNRFANRKVKARGMYVESCLNPGGNQPYTVFYVDEYHIGDQGSRC